MISKLGIEQMGGRRRAPSKEKKKITELNSIKSDFFESIGYESDFDHHFANIKNPEFQFQENNFIDQQFPNPPQPFNQYQPQPPNFLQQQQPPNFVQQPQQQIYYVTDQFGRLIPQLPQNRKLTPEEMALLESHLINKSQISIFDEDIPVQLAESIYLGDHNQNPKSSLINQECIQISNFISLQECSLLIKIFLIQ